MRYLSYCLLCALIASPASAGAWKTGNTSPEKVTHQQLADVVYQYLHAHPRDRHNNAASEVINALSRSFPCM